MLGRHATAARREGDEYVLQFDGGAELRGDRLLVATGRRPRVEGIGLETVGVEADPRGIRGRRVPARRRAALGDRRRHRHLAADPRRRVRGRRGRGEHRRRSASGELRSRSAGHLHGSAGGGGRRDRKRTYSATAPVSEVPKTATYTHAYAESNGFLTLLSDGERLTGAYALGPEAGEWLQQATLAIRAHVPLEVLERHDPALPELLGDLRPGGEGAAHADRGHAAAGRTDGRADGRPFVSAAEQFHVSEVSPAYWRVTFDNGPVNLLDPDTVDQLAALIGRIEDAPDLTVVVFRSDKPGYFMAHWDFLSDNARVAAMRPGPTGPAPVRGQLRTAEQAAGGHDRGDPWSYPRRGQRVRPRHRHPVRVGGGGPRPVRGRRRRRSRRRSHGAAWAASSAAAEPWRSCSAATTFPRAWLLSTDT